MTRNPAAALKRRFKKLHKFLTLKILFPLTYKWHARKPVDPKKVIYIEVRLPELSNSFQLIYKELEEHYDVRQNVHLLRIAFVTTMDYTKRCMNLLRDMATAKYVFIGDASACLGSVKKRPETTVFQTWHGCGAFKKFGFSTAELIFGENEKNMLRYPVYRNIDLVSVSSPEIVWAYEEAMNSKRFGMKVIPAGVSRTDIFYDEQFKKAAYEKLYSLIPGAEGKKVILYAPTFRGRVAKAKTSNMLNTDLLNYALSDEYVLLFKHHPIVQKLPEIQPCNSEFAFDVTETMTIEELICVSDICISDYSSLIFEYSLLERPMIFFAYDIDSYIDWRGFYYKYEDFVPGPIVKDNFEILNYIKNIDTCFDKQKVIDFKKKFMESCDGHSTERILKLMFKDDLEKLRK